MTSSSSTGSNGIPLYLYSPSTKARLPLGVVNVPCEFFEQGSLLDRKVKALAQEKLEQILPPSTRGVISLNVVQGGRISKEDVLMVEILFIPKSRRT